MSREWDEVGSAAMMGMEARGLPSLSPPPLPHEIDGARGLHCCRCRRHTKETGRTGAQPMPSSSLPLEGHSGS